MRRTLTELFGLDVPLWQQYLNFWGRFIRGDLGPSLMGFPVPALKLVMLALPWTAGLLTSSILITWVLGNFLGGLAGYFQNTRLLKLFGIVSIGIQPIPHYIVAFLMVIIFGFLWPILPISGGFAMNVRPGWNWHFALSILHHSMLPAFSLVIVGLGTWFLGMRALVSNIVTEDYVTYAELANVRRGRIVGSYVIRNALVPQLTALCPGAGRHLFRHHHHRAGLHLSGPWNVCCRCRQRRRQIHGARGLHGIRSPLSPWRSSSSTCCTHCSTLA